MSLFRDIAELAEMLAKEPGRLKKRAAIAEAIRTVHEAAPETEDAGRFALYLAGSPFAEADPRKLNAGGALLSKALLAVSGATQIALTAAYKHHGDIGAAGFDLLAAGRQESGDRGIQCSAHARGCLRRLCGNGCGKDDRNPCRAGGRTARACLLQ